MAIKQWNNTIREVNHNLLRKGNWSVMKSKLLLQPTKNKTSLIEIIYFLKTNLCEMSNLITERNENFSKQRLDHAGKFVKINVAECNFLLLNEKRMQGCLGLKKEKKGNKGDLFKC